MLSVGFSHIGPDWEAEARQAVTARSGRAKTAASTSIAKLTINSGGNARNKKGIDVCANIPIDTAAKINRDPIRRIHAEGDSRRLKNSPERTYSAGGKMIMSPRASRFSTFEPQTH